MREQEEFYLIPSSIPLREAWQKALPLYFDNFLLFVGVLLVAQVAAEILNFFLVLEGQPLFIRLLASLPGLALVSMGYYALVQAVTERSYGEPITLLEALGYSFAMLGPILLTNLVLLGVLLLPLAVLLVASIPLALLLGGLGSLVAGVGGGAVLGSFFAFVPFVLVAEGRYGWSAIRRSFELTKREWGKVAITMIAVLLPPLILDRAFEESWVVFLLQALYEPLPLIVLAELYRSARAQLGEL